MSEEKQSGSLRKYLMEKKSARDDKGIEKGKDLARTPVKKIVTGKIVGRRKTRWH